MTNLTPPQRTRVINPFKHARDVSWFATQQIYDPNGISRALKSTEGSGNIPKILIRYGKPIKF